MTEGTTVLPSRRLVAPPRTLAGPLAFANAHRRALGVVLAVGLYFGFACYVTWPLVTDPAHVFYGAAGDPYGSMAFYRELVTHHLNPFLPGHISQFSAPEGQAIPWTRDLASMPSVLVVYCLTALFGAMTANGVYILAGYTVTGTIMFLFVRRLTGNTWIALIAGWALAFFPFAVINGSGHYDYVWTGMLVLGVWRMLELMWHPSTRNALLAGLAVALGMWWAPYFILFGGVAYAAALVTTLVIAWRDRELKSVLAAQAIAAAIVVLFLGGLAALSTGPAGNSIGLRSNNVQQFNTYSARPLEYVLPDSRSPLFGSLTQHYLSTHLHGSNGTEATLYVGVTVMLLALLAVIALVRRRLDPRTSRAVIVLGFIALAVAVCSAPPEARVFGLLIPFPSHFIAKVTSTWRVYSRFVVIVMVALVALASVGLSSLVRGRRPGARMAILVAASVLIPLDLWAHSYGVINRLHPKDVPSVYYALKRQPPGLAAEYPLVPTGFDPTYDSLFFQSIHGKPLLNGYLEGTVEEHRALSLANLADPATAPRLAALGVRYVLLESTPPSYGLPAPGTPGRGFQRLAQDAFGTLYRVTAQPAGLALPAVADGFADTETDAMGTFNWLQSPVGTLELAGRCSRCSGVLTMTVASFARPRVVTVTTSDGRVLARTQVAGPTKLTVPFSYVGHAQLDLRTSPGPQSIQKTIGGPDTRSVSVQVRDLAFVASARSAAARSRSPRA